MNDKPVTRTVDLAAEVRKIWGKQWNEPELEYEFSNGKQFKRRTEEAAIYQEQE